MNNAPQDDGSGESDRAWRHRPRVVQSETFAMSSVGFGLPAIVVAGGLGWLGTQGYPAAWLVMGLLVAVGLRGIFLAFKGGVLLRESSVEIRSWFTADCVARSSVCSVVERVDRAGEPSGWLVTSGGEEVKLRGATSRHQHNPFSNDGCMVCDADHANLVRIAADLAVPLVDGGSTRWGSVGRE